MTDAFFNPSWNDDSMKIFARFCWFLVFAFAFCSFTWGENPEDPFRLDKGVFPVFQAVNLLVDADEDSYSGSVTMDLKVVARTNTFRFHAEDLEIEKITLSGGLGLMETSYKIGPKGTVTLETGRNMAPGDYSLTIRFSNDFNRQAVSLYKTETEGSAYTFTQFESEYARQAFPCWDEPEFKIPWQVTLTVPEGHRAVSNTPAVMEEVKDGYRTVAFKKTAPMPVYLVALATGPLDAIPVTGMSVPGKIYTIKDRASLANEMARVSAPILRELENYFDRPYPYEKLDQLAVPEFLWGAMENVGAIVYRDSIVLMDEGAVTFDRRKRLAGIVAHEMAHMWFGNLVTTRWWNDIWLNESFASWMGNKITDRAFPDFKLSQTNVAYGQRAMKVDALPSTPTIRRQHLASDDPEKMFDSLSYNKGMAVLGMVEQWMGEENFRRGMQEYMKVFAWGNATSDDLWSILDRHTESNLTALMGSFIDQPGVPLVSAEILPGNRLRLAQKRLINYGLKMPAAALWQIPVVLRYWDGHELRTEKLLLWENSQTFDLPAEGPILWVHPNVGEKGYYCWQAQPAVLKKLARYSSEILDLRERVGFIDNLTALFKAGNLGGRAYLQTLGIFAHDSSPQVLQTLAGAVGALYLTFISEETEEAYGAYLRTILKPALDKIGLQRQDGEAEAVASLRATLLGRLAGRGNDTEVRKYAQSLASAYLEKPDSIDPSLAGAALNATAFHGDIELFEQIRKKFESTEFPAERSRLLNALGSFRKPEMLAYSLEYSLTADLRPHESMAIPQRWSADPQFQQRVFSWMMEHYETIKKRTPPRYLGMLPTLVDGRDIQLLEEARQFFSSHGRMTPMIEKRLAEVSDQVLHRARLKDKESESIAKYLAASNADNDSTRPVQEGD